MTDETKTATPARETFAAARARIVAELAALGAPVRAGLKVPRAEVLGGLTLELRAQSAHVSSPHRTLSVCSDYRGVPAHAILRLCADARELLADPEISRPSP
jgi:hypothetical protein